MPRKYRATPDGFRKTSYEMQESAKRTLADLVRALDRDGFPAVAETAVLEALILTAKREGVDRDVLAKVLRARAAAFDRATNPRR
ncbi:MAG TPA: hypothetical protein VGI19_18605 [Candidatus Cybelea sp.]|jgi:hypothetical protein